MQFQIPQFIEIEDKIFGPFTLKQFIYLIGGAGGAFIAYSLIPSFYIALFPMAGIAGLALMLAFRRINNRPFSTILESGFKFYTKKKLYLWRKEDKRQDKRQRIDLEKKEVNSSPIPSVSENRLENISWNLDVNTGDGAEEKELSNIEI
jgi:hypothetical protein